MAKKIFVRAKVSTGKRWVIDYQQFNPENGELTRRRQDFDLNQIENVEVRQLVADRICKFLETFSIDTEIVAGETVNNAMEIALSVKLSAPRENTRKGYQSIGKKFLLWCGKNNLKEIPVSSFSKKHAHQFFDWVKSKRYASPTINNHIIHLRALWSEMERRDIVKENPWKAIKPAKTGEKNRRTFTPGEIAVIAEYIRKTDYWMFRALLLQFFCYIRPGEISRLKFKNFDLAKGIVTVEAHQAKQWRTRRATIPASVLHYFVDGVFDKQPVNFYVLGLQVNGRGESKVAPSREPAREDRMYIKHKKALVKLKKEGKLADISGLTWYSWKDTGISLHAQKTTPLATRDQAGHTDFDQTLTYYHPDAVNPEYRRLENDLI